MAELISTFAKAENNECYSDGSIEVEMLEMVRSGKVDWLWDRRWPIVYHFSELRENILNWYPFTQKDTVLEIGAGCGAITGVLCERAGFVDALELTEIRSQINYARHSDCEHLRIFITDLKDYRTDRKYDYVVVNGVLEYAAYMFHDDNPYVAFLNCAKSFLKPDGRILLAIENRLGLKYFSGSREDHTGKRFSGLNGYAEGEKVKTFSKEELTCLVNQAGLYTVKHYYPYPDYKFPEEIFTDESINRRLPLTRDYHLSASWACLFDEQSVQKAMITQGVMDAFSNSFLFEISQKPDCQSNSIDYVKLSANRSAKYRIATLLYTEENRVVKRALTPACNAHLKQMSKNALLCQNGLVNIPCVLGDGEISFPLMKEKTLAEKMEEALRAGNEQEACAMLASIGQRLCRDLPLAVAQPSKEFEQIFGPVTCSEPMHWGCNLNVDMGPDNLFCVGDEWHIADYEWVFPFPIPVEFAMWRMVALFSVLHPSFGMNAFLRSIGITETMEKVFRQWEGYFVINYVESKLLFQLTQNEEKVFFLERPMGRLFWRVNGDFCEEMAVDGECRSGTDEDEIVARFRLPEKTEVREFRWDPVEGYGCEVELMDISLPGKIQSIAVNEGTMEGNLLKLYSFDPQVFIRGDFSPTDQVEIRFRFQAMERDKTNRLRYDALRDAHDALQSAYDALSQTHNRLQDEYSTILHSTSWKWTAPLRKMTQVMKGHTK